MKRRDFNKAMVLTAGGIAVPSWVGEAEAAGMLFVKSAPSVYRLDASDFPGAGVAYVFTEANHADNYNVGGQGTQVSWDSGQEAVKMTMPSESGANGCGDIRFAGVHDRTEKVVSFCLRMRVDQSFLDGGGYVENGGSTGESPKVFITYYGESCSNDEITFTNGRFRQVLDGYARCGSSGFNIDDGNDIDLQPGGDTSWSYNALPNIEPIAGKPDPFTYRANDWFTFCYFVDLGASPQPFEVWARYDNGAFSDKWYQVMDFTFDELRTPATSCDDINSIQLTIYATGKDNTVVHTPWNIWYQDVLMTVAQTHAQVKSVYGIP